ncbi:MAG: hypothetical protein ACI8RZ_005812, partial [Myxococcota bacterium]
QNNTINKIRGEGSHLTGFVGLTPSPCLSPNRQFTPPKGRLLPSLNGKSIRQPPDRLRLPPPVPVPLPESAISPSYDRHLLNSTAGTLSQPPDRLRRTHPVPAPCPESSARPSTTGCCRISMGSEEEASHPTGSVELRPSPHRSPNRQFQTRGNPPDSKRHGGSTPADSNKTCSFVFGSRGVGGQVV